MRDVVFCARVCGLEIGDWGLGIRVGGLEIRVWDVGVRG
jgi:hypothetical protein